VTNAIISSFFLCRKEKRLEKKILPCWAPKTLVDCWPAMAKQRRTQQLQ